MLWGNTDVKSGTGTIAIANVDANAIYGTLTGTSTLLGTEVKVGNYIIADGRKYLLVAITSNTAGVVAGDLTGVALANVDAGNTFTVQEGPAFIGSEDKGDLDDIFGVDVTEATVSGNASVQQYLVTFKGSGYFSAPTVTVGGNATGTATANGTGYISAIAVGVGGNTYTVAPAVTVDPPAEQTFNSLGYKTMAEIEAFGQAANGLPSVRKRSSVSFLVSHLIPYNASQFSGSS